MHAESTSLPDASALDGWRKSSHSGGNNGECLEVCDGHPGDVPVRDSKRAAGPAVVFAAASWSAFLATLR